MSLYHSLPVLLTPGASIFQNRRRAFQVLRARLTDQRLIMEQAERRAARQNLVRTADRSEKIRTYNYPQVRIAYPISSVLLRCNFTTYQDRVTDHRLGKRSISWDGMMETHGLQDFIQALKEKYDADTVEEKLAELEAELVDN